MQKIHSADLGFRGLLSKFIPRTSDFADFYQIHSADLGFRGLFLRSAGSAESTWPKNMSVFLADCLEFFGKIGQEFVSILGR